MQAAQVLFHPLKHHLATLQALIRHSRKADPAEQIAQLKTLGASQFDLYTGVYSVAELKAITAEMLYTQGLRDENDYRQWIVDNGGFRTIQLPDESNWTLRYLQRNDFVHLHPSRYSPRTLRIKANAMKSVAAYLLLKPGAPLDIQQLNAVRKNFLELSPITAAGNYDEIHKVYLLLTNP